MLIQIVNTPKGNFAPPEIRELWNGIVLKVAKKEPLTDLDMLLGRLGEEDTSKCGHIVHIKTALSALEHHNKLAYMWWSERIPQDSEFMIFFNAGACRIIG